MLGTKSYYIARVIALTFVVGMAIPSRILAKSSETFINDQIKDAYIKDFSDSQKATQEFVPTHKAPIDDEIYENYTPMKPSETVLRDARPTGPGEQPGSFDRPGGNSAKAVDPAKGLEEGIADKQDYQRFRQNYRDAVQQEFINRAGAAGVKTNKNISEEIRAAEQLKNLETQSPY